MMNPNKEIWSDCRPPAFKISIGEPATVRVARVLCSEVRTSEKPFLLGVFCQTSGGAHSFRDSWLGNRG